MSAFLRFSALFLFASCLCAQEQPGAGAGGETDLPQPLDTSMADALLTHSPFTRIVNLEETLQLTGIAYVDGRPVATFVNRVTQERLTVSEVPNEKGWRLTEAIPGTELQDTVVHVMIEGEDVTMHYGSSQLTPGVGKKGMPGTYAAHSGSGGDNHIKTSSLLGANGKDLYVSLSREGRDKLKEIVHEHMEKHPEQTMEQNSAYAQKIYAKIKAADQKSSGNGNSSNSNSNNDRSRGMKPGKTR